MKKHEMIDFLIENEDVSQWGEDDRATLEALSEGGLRRLVEAAQVLANAKGEDDEEEEDYEEEEGKKGKGKKGKGKMAKNAKSFEGDEDGSDDDDGNGGQAVETDVKGKKKKSKGTVTNMFQQPKEKDDEAVVNEQEEMTINEYLENAPPKMREMLQGGIQVFNQRKKQLVDMIYNHENNTGNFTRDWLSQQEMPLLEGMARLVGNGRKRVAHYTGAASGAQTTPILQNSRKVQPLVAPRMTFNDRRATAKR